MTVLIHFQWQCPCVVTLYGSMHMKHDTDGHMMVITHYGELVGSNQLVT